MTDNQDIGKPGSDRAFGFVFFVFFLLLSGFSYWSSGHRYVSLLVVASFFLISAIFLPKILHPLNFIWFKLGLLLHSITTPLMLGAMFYIVFTPIGQFMRIMKRRPLDLSFDTSKKTYWITRDEMNATAHSFKNQF